MSKKKEPEPAGEGPQRNRNGDRRTAHVEYLERKLEGGPKPTAEAYARAARQWQHLPGAVRSMPPIDIAPAPEASEPTDTNPGPPAGEPPGQAQQS